jgi:hypothetical protein
VSEWQTCAVPDSFVKNKVGRQNQIPGKEIAEVGRFPVVDQRQKFVAGYCDDESKVIVSVKGSAFYSTGCGRLRWED